MRFPSQYTRVIFAAFLLFTFAILVSNFVPPAHATVGLVVTKTLDTNDGVCDSDCSLREAIIAANTLAGADTITLPAGTYTLTITGTGENLAATGDLDINSDVTLTGAGADSTIIEAGTIGYPSLSANGIDRVFEVRGTFTVSISGVTIRNGKTALKGGGIYHNNGTLTVTNSAFSGNSGSQDGGGIHHENGTLTVTNSAFSDNYGNEGGGIHNNNGTLTVTNSAFSDNFASYGGGINIFPSGEATVTVTNSTFSDNSTVYRGGGIHNTYGTLTVTNSTFSGNSVSSGIGGGVYNDIGTLTVTNSTLSGNSATKGGGGIYNVSTLATTTLKNTIVANSPSGGDCVNVIGTLTADAFNIDSDGSCDGATTKTTAEIALGSLAPNGGPTDTMAPGNSSAAIDAGDNTVCADTNTVNNLDQRGVARPQGTHCDVGAFEASFIYGQKFRDNNGDGVKNGGDSALPDWMIQLQDTSGLPLGTTATDASGNYTFTIGTLPFTYRVREVSQNGWTQTTTDPADLALTLNTPGASVVNFGNFENVTLGGVKFNDINGNGIQDADEPGLKGWTIQLHDTSDNVLDTTVTEEGGFYTFADNGPGTYRVREVNKPGWVQMTANPADTTVVSGQDVMDLHFGNLYQADVSIVKTYKQLKNGSVVFTLAVSNAGPGKAKRVVVTDTLPDLWKYATVKTSQGTCTFETTNGTLACSLGNLKANGSATITLTVTPPKSDNSFTNCADVKSKTYDPKPSNNTSCISRP